jgi:hypothetical protein
MRKSLWRQTTNNERQALKLTMQSKAKTVAGYLQSVPEDRRHVMIEIRKAIKNNLPDGFEETMNYGMIGYVVPHKIYPEGYHCDPDQPLPFISLASQKNYISLYHLGLYEGGLLEWFADEWPVYSHKKLDIGKCCVRFKKPEDVPIDLIGALATKMTPRQWIIHYEKSINRNTSQKSKPIKK